MGRLANPWTAIGLGYLAVVDLVTGVWAVADPKGWYRDFPGFGRHWAAANPPYNHHLVLDAGAGFLAVGVVLTLALAWRERRAAQLALLASLAHDLPHLAFHVAHPAAAMSGADKLVSTGGLALGCAVAALLLAVVWRQPVGASPAR